MMIGLVGIGAGCGALTRYFLGKWISLIFPHSFPFGTWVINITGSFILGILANLYTSQQIAEWIWFLAGIGFLGAYTTFSTFSYEAIDLIIKRRVTIAICYIISSLLLCVLGAYIGFLLV